jgi:hypothetical protein
VRARASETELPIVDLREKEETRERKLKHNGRQQSSEQLQNKPFSEQLSMKVSNIGKVVQTLKCR